MVRLSCLPISIVHVPNVLAHLKNNQETNHRQEFWLDSLTVWDISVYKSIQSLKSGLIMQNKIVGLCHEWARHICLIEGRQAPVIGLGQEKNLKIREMFIKTLQIIYQK